MLMGKIVYYGYWKDDSPYLKLSDESYETDNIGSSNDETCCICLDNKCDVITKCNHTFCYECLSKNYDNATQYLKFRCKRNHIFLRNRNQMTNNGRWCINCKEIDGNYPKIVF